MEADDGRGLVVDGAPRDAGAGVDDCSIRKSRMTLARVGTAIGDRIGRSGSAAGVLRPLYAGWLRAAYGRRGLPWHVNGESFRIDPSVRHLVPHESEASLFQFLRSGIRPGDVVLDIGAFLGTYAVMAARWSGATGPGPRV